MSDSPNLAEYTVDQKAEEKYLRNRILLIVLYVAFGLLYFIGMSLIKMPMLICVLPVFIWMLVFFTWRYVSVEHEYAIVSGTVTFADVYGGRSRKTIAEAKIRDMEEIAPLTEETERRVRSSADTVIDMRGSVHTPDAYFCTYRNDKNKKVCILFEATGKTLKSFKYYNSSTVMSTTLRY